MKTVNTYIATNTTIYAREEQGMVCEATEKRKSKSTKKSSSADNTHVKVISEVAGSRKRVATKDIAPVIPTKRRTVKTKHSSAQASLDIMPVAQDVVPIQVIVPTPAATAIKSPALKQKSRKWRLVLSTRSDDATVGTQEIVKDSDAFAVSSTDEADIIITKVLEETLELGVSETERGDQGVDEAVFEEDFARWLDDFVARNSEPEFVDTRIDTRAEGSISPMVDKEMNKSVDSEQVTEETMSNDDLLLQISDDLMLPSITVVNPVKLW
ncbi:cation/H(+) antiporter 15-like [Dorcoceras hygrometricum]|uniref:Cation/H(+) antiporter 15-like n=1 Tax=Dorcoceras hygrometricum TaxID=472368 RepID=A0A2Z6ZU04_9LAMI|nr:cation/H(+) antiporter 15-like [Dorcoceras hygrometricum]